ncbi:uncharacterized protein LOC125503097 [Dendroctonus ponderosae]|uniref:uncharacterized protein LOC125503097 n=1 Tax=Dendroctonus ponderosae TaxID=77166 RepID=UPI002035E604|nr:uncharacterized protein LOC125503097 [Dendroctonus ponderosae]
MATFWVICLVPLVLLVAKLFDRAPPKIFGVYSRPGGLFWPKAVWMLGLLWLKRLAGRLRPQAPDYYTALERPQPLPDTALAVDAVYFNATNREGDCLFVGTARRPLRLVDTFLYLKVGELGLLQLPLLPDSAHFNTGEELSYQAGGVHIKCLEPMKVWTVEYQGELREADDPARLHDVTIKGVFTSGEPCFNSSTDLDVWSMAKALALEPWSRAFFKNVKAAHQLHYEQFGVLEADVQVGGAAFKLRLDTVRDHSVGAHRDWASYQRYALHWLTAANGDHVAIGALCHPGCYSRLHFGYLYRARDARMLPISDCDLQLHQQGEQGTPPRDYAFTFKAGGHAYDVQLTLLRTPHFYISQRWEAKLYECQCRARVNGLPAWGGVEWQYRNVGGRPTPQ